MKRKTFGVFLLILFLLPVFAQSSLSNYVRTITDEYGNQIDELIVPGRPPENHHEPIAETTRATVIISDMPAYDWSFGCSATAAAMMNAYHDRHGYSNMYTGPGGTPAGVMPLDNSEWGDVWIATEGVWRHQCPLSATMNGLDGRAIRGHVDDYWYDYGTNNDPYIDDPGGGWTEHTQGECTGDYMGTNQFYNWASSDGSTTYYFMTDGSPLHDFTACESYVPPRKDGCHGFRQFVESRGYTVLTNYSQYIDTYHPAGFTYNQYKAEIDAGRTVMIQIEDHSMVGFGYDDTTSNLIYIHDTWDYLDHTMIWGGTYSGSQHYGVGVYGLDDPPTPVELTSFAAAFNNGQPDLYWQTQSESNNSGWNIYRSQSDNLEDAYQINNNLIPGAGTTSEPTEYSFTDEYSVSENATFWYWIENKELSGATFNYGPISITIPPQQEIPEPPETNISYLSNYPNPFSSHTEISFNMKEAGDLEVSIFNTKGQLIKVLWNGFYAENEFNVSWNGKDKNGKELSSGIYLYIIKTSGGIYSKRMILMK